MPGWGACLSGKVSSSHQLHSLCSWQHPSQVEAGNQILYMYLLWCQFTVKLSTSWRSCSVIFIVLCSVSQNGVDFLRLGSILRVHPTIQLYTPARICDHLDMVQSVEEVYHSKPVVATTCLGVSHPIFMRLYYVHVHVYSIIPYTSTDIVNLYVRKITFKFLSQQTVYFMKPTCACTCTCVHIINHIMMILY